MRSAVAAAVAAVALAILIGGEPSPTFALDWDVVEDRIQARWPAVRSVSYDPDEDFVTVVVTDSTTVEEAAAASCATVFPVMHNAGSRALFAIYTEDGRIVASWNRCVALPPG